MDPIKCLVAINDAKSDVQGNDPRTWMKACAEETLIKGKSGKHFKNCLIKKMETTKHHIENPAEYADELYNSIKSACKQSTVIMSKQQLNLRTQYAARRRQGIFSKTKRVMWKERSSHIA